MQIFLHAKFVFGFVDSSSNIFKQNSHCTFSIRFGFLIVKNILKCHGTNTRSSSFKFQLFKFKGNLLQYLAVETKL